MSKQAGGRPAKSGARRELKTFRLVPDAIERLERLAGERGGSTSDVLNELLLEALRTADVADVGRPRLEVVTPGFSPEPPPATVARFRVLPGGGKNAEDGDPRVAHELERLRDGLGVVLDEIEGLMAEQIAEDPAEQAPTKGKTSRATRSEVEFASGFRAGMLEALETAYVLLQGELLNSEV